MKKEKKSPMKGKSRKNSSSSSDSEVQGTSGNQTVQRVLVEESSKQANVTMRLENADMLAKYRQKNPHIKIENPKTSTNCIADEISDDDEIWICDVPNSIDVNKILGKSIKLGSKKSTIETDEGDIVCSTSKFEKTNGTYQNTLSVIFQKNNSQFSMKNIKPVGRMMFSQKMDDSEVEIDVTPAGRPESTKFPDDLIERHPLFGRNFEDKLELKESIKKKLADAALASQHSEPSVRIKREKNNSESQSSPKKAKKRKADSADDSVALKKPKEEIKTESGLDDDDVDRIKLLFEKSQ